MGNTLEPYTIDPDAILSADDPEEAMRGIAYAIFQEYMEGYELFQQGGAFPISRWSPEDLPSNHLGFIAYSDYRDMGMAAALAYVILQLAEGDVDRLSFPYWNGGRTGFRSNKEWYFQSCSLFECSSIPWPDVLAISPIASSPDTWQRVD